MATVANTRSTLVDLLKIVYEKNLNAAIPREVFLLGALKKVKYDGRGKQYTFATHLKANTMVASRGAQDYFASALPEGVAQGSVVPAYVHIPFEITNDLIKAAKGGDKVAFRDGMKVVRDNSQTTITADLNRQAAGDQRGIMATLTANVPNGAATGTASVDTTKFLEDGMVLDLWNGNALVNAAAGPYPKVNIIIDGTSFTLAMTDGSNIPAGYNVGFVFVRQGNAFLSGTRQSYEANGLRLFADDGTLDPAGGLHGISASTYFRWKGLTLDAAAAAFGPGVASGVGIVFRQRSNGRFNAIWANPLQTHALIYGTLGSYQDKRYVNGKVEEIGANEEDIVINVAGRKVRVRSDVTLSSSEAFFFDSSALRYVELNPVELEEQADGQYLTPWRDSTGQRPAQVGYWMWRGNFACAIRNSVARVYNLAVPATVPAGWVY